MSPSKNLAIEVGLPLELPAVVQGCGLLRVISTAVLTFEAPPSAETDAHMPSSEVEGLSPRDGCVCRDIQKLIKAMHVTC